MRTLSSLGKRDLIKAARDRRPDTPEQLWLYMRAFFNLEVPHTPCCKDHLTPFHMIWFLHNRVYPEFAVLGSRASMKTLGLSAAETLDILHNDTSVVHIGAIEKQANRGYNYVRKFLYPVFEDRVKASLMSRTELKNGNHLEILPCTINQVNGPHESRVNFDEVELANPLAYQEAKGIPVANYKTGQPPSICYASTRKFASGLFGQEMERLRKIGKPVVTFCFKDVTQRCPDSRSGKNQIPVYVDTNTFAWSLYPAHSDMRLFQVYEKCVDCSLLPTCRGDLKNSYGTTSIEEIKIRFETSTPEFWIAQAECRKPVRRGMMIYNFNQACIEKSINWNRFLDKYGRFDNTRYFMVGGKDFNYCPDATLMCVIDRHTDDIYVIKEFRIEMKTMPTICAEILDWCVKTPFSLPVDIQCDKSEPGLIATMKSSGLSMSQGVEESDVEGGVDLINFLCMPRTRPPLIHIDATLAPTLIWEMEEGYKRKIDPRTGEPGEDPDARNNHFIDCLRYVVWKYLQKYAQPYEVMSGSAAGDTGGIIEEFKKSLVMPSGGNIDENEMAKIAVLLNEKVV